MNEKTILIQTQFFEICIDSHLNDQRRKYFDGLQVTQLKNGKTQISGEIRDQAQLFGILIRIRDMGIPLLSVNFIQPKNKLSKGDAK